MSEDWRDARIAELERLVAEAIDQRDEMKSRHDLTVEANKLLAAKLERQEAQVAELEATLSTALETVEAVSLALVSARRG